MGKHNWGSSRVLVTGATGMIGSWLCRELVDRGASVVTLIRDLDSQSELIRSGTYDRVSTFNGQLQDFEAVERAINEGEVDTVIHLGAQAIVGTAERSPLGTWEANVRGTYNVLEACRVHADMVKRTVIASTDKAYGEQDTLPYVETMELKAKFPYEASKACADLIAQSYYASYDIPLAIVRCGNVFGGGDLNWSRLVPGTIKAFAQKASPEIRSDGSYERDYIYVKDVVAAYLAVAEQLDDPAVRGESFNFGNEKPVTVLEMVDLVRQLMGAHEIDPIVQGTASGEIHSQYVSTEKARRILGWEPGYSLEEGLEETITWYRQQIFAAVGS